MSTTTTILNSTRFGTLEIPADAVIEFPNGLIGLGGARYTLVAQEEDSAFVWLHSLEDADLALPVTNPWVFFADYEVEVGDDEAERLGLEGEGQTSVYVTVRAAARPEDTTANLAAPILICGRHGHQVINQSPHAPVRAPLFTDAAESHQAA